MVSSMGFTRIFENFFFFNLNGKPIEIWGLVALHRLDGLGFFIYRDRFIKLRLNV